MKEKQLKDRSLIAQRITKIYGITLLVAAAVLLVLSFLLYIDEVQEKYSRWLGFINDIEVQVSALQDRWLVVVVLLMLFLLRCLLPAYPLSVILVTTGVVFPPWPGFFINMTGMAASFAMRYYTGREMGEGYALKLLRRYPIFDSVLETNGLSNTVLLFIFRLFPGVPVNSVSQIYGSLQFPFIRYMAVSLAAIIPTMVTYSFIGKSATDPLSPSFLAPIIVLLTVSGLVLLFFNAILSLVTRLKDDIDGKRKNEKE